MRWSVIRLIWFREVRDQLRDRRTLFMLLVVPLILYPGLGLAMVQFVGVCVEKPVVVGVAGAELLAKTEPAAEDRFALPSLPPLLDGDRFAEGLFQSREARHLLHVVYDTPESLREKLSRGEIHAYLEFTPEFVGNLKAGTKAVLPLWLRGGDTLVGNGAEPDSITAESRKPITVSTDDERGQLAYDRLRPVLREWRDQILKARLRLLGAPNDQYGDPFQIPILRTQDEYAWSKIFPFLIVMMSLTGALYPAIDVCAGEKERGTMETLLISPASRAEIVTGKFLTVWLFSTVSALLNLASLGFTAWQFSRAGAALGGSEAVLPVPSMAALGWGIVLLVPLAAFFSAVCLALAVYARSTREGQYYLMPLTLVTMMLTFLSLMPGTELTALYSILPITGATLLLQALMTAKTAEEVPWLYLAPVLLPLAAYCYLALHWAIYQFNREDVLFREAERLDLRLWLRRKLERKEPFPSAAEAVICFGLIMLLGWLIRSNWISTDILLPTAAYQVLGITGPAVVLAWLFTSQPLATLRLRWPSSPFADNFQGPGAVLIWIGIALLLALAVHGPAVVTTDWLVQQFPQLEEQLKELSERLELNVSLPVQLLVLALLPAMCEELAFRGFILSGLGSRLTPGKAILVTSLLFAFAHLHAFRFPATFVLGLLLGLLAIRSGSLLPGVIFHSVHNGLIVIVAFFSKQALEAGQQHWLLSDDGWYSLPAVITSVIVAVGMIAGLLFWNRPAGRDEA
jgi:sodium transport system permease protein